MTCAHASVFAMVDGSWRFAHDKLRETVLGDLSTDEQPSLHRRVAQGIEALYPKDTAYAEALATHWEHAGEDQQAAAYLLQAGEQLYYAAAFPRAKRLLRHALDDLTPTEKCYSIPLRRTRTILSTKQESKTPQMGRFVLK